MGASTLSSHAEAQASKTGRMMGTVCLQIREIGVLLVHPQVSQ